MTVEQAIDDLRIAAQNFRTAIDAERAHVEALRVAAEKAQAGYAAGVARVEGFQTLVDQIAQDIRITIELAEQPPSAPPLLAGERAPNVLGALGGPPPLSQQPLAIAAQQPAFTAPPVRDEITLGDI